VAPLKIVLGLGNPGPEYENTRHNAGFLTVSLLGERLGASYWRDEHGARTALVRFGDEDLTLALPQTFMNKSGRSVRRLVEAYEVGPEDLVVVHDDIDLPAETVRAKRGGGHGGNNGLRSLIADLGHGDFLRVRIGIGRPPGRLDPADYVLEPLGRKGFEALESVLPTAAQCAIHILEHGVESAMQEFNGE
jgi:PTH1 family peptidyl-tRNA hydrolase